MFCTIVLLSKLALFAIWYNQVLWFFYTVLDIWHVWFIIRIFLLFCWAVLQLLFWHKIIEHMETNYGMYQDIPFSIMVIIMVQLCLTLGSYFDISSLLSYSLFLYGECVELLVFTVQIICLFCWLLFLSTCLSCAYTCVAIF